LSRSRAKAELWYVAPSHSTPSHVKAGFIRMNDTNIYSIGRYANLWMDIPAFVT
jgi:hypothetical protein